LGSARLAPSLRATDGTIAVDMDPLSLLCRLATTIGVGYLTLVNVAVRNALAALLGRFKVEGR
jgi:hypothetical protein